MFKKISNIKNTLCKFSSRILFLIKKDKYRVAAFIVNYNMPERADSLYEKLKENSKWPLDIYLIDNGSDIKDPALNTNIYIRNNVQTCRGWLHGLQTVKNQGKKYFAYMFLITSTNFLDNNDCVTPMANFLSKHKNAVGIHPALSIKSTTYWKHLITRGGNEPRETWMIDNIASMYRSDWFDRIGWFDPEMIYAWGIDLETCYLARKEGKTLWVDERVKVTKITNIGYKMKRMNMKATDRVVLADKNMREVLEEKYGSNYWEKMTNDYVSERML